MQHTFFHKLILVIVAGCFAAALIQFYRHMIVGADKAINQGYKSNYGISQSR
jgi:hypothetical protein